VNKIIGFYISKSKREFKYDIFNKDLNLIILNKGNFFIYLWGIGNISKCIIDKSYSLSFPLDKSLLDRNILISIDEDKIIIENDCLGSIPIFYNDKIHRISTLSNLCIGSEKKIHQEGLSNFCEFGYSVFEQTPLEDVKFMRYFSKLVFSKNGILVKDKDDPVLEEDFVDEESSSRDVIMLMQNYISNIENNTEGDIVLPTSGGYDSRILNYLVKDKHRIKSFTYGNSKDQSQSTEVVHAKKISEIYNTSWNQIELESFHQYIEEWFDLFGMSTHLHGMYHIEFYTKIMNNYSLNNATFLSGIVGDAWAGSINYKKIKNIDDITTLGYSHGINLNKTNLNYISTNELMNDFFHKNKLSLQDDRIKAIFTIRMKLILISYLTQLPEYFGLPVWTPFLNFNIVKTTLNLPHKKRINRVWEKDFFKEVGLDLEEMALISIKSNNLDYEIMKNATLEPINIDLMKQYINEEKLLLINSTLLKLTYSSKLSFIEVFKNNLLSIPKLGGVLRLLGFKNRMLRTLYEYYIIKAIEKGLKYES
jgi:hypothetical protein